MTTANNTGGNVTGINRAEMFGNVPATTLWDIQSYAVLVGPIWGALLEKGTQPDSIGDTVNGIVDSLWSAFKRTSMDLGFFSNLAGLMGPIVAGYIERGLIGDQLVNSVLRDLGTALHNYATTANSLTKAAA